MINYSSTQIAAAELADRYIEIILSTKPELIVSGMGTARDALESAGILTQFRKGLILNLTEQPVPNPDLED